MVVAKAVQEDHPWLRSFTSKYIGTGKFPRTTCKKRVLSLSREAAEIKRKTGRKRVPKKEIIRGVCMPTQSVHTKEKERARRKVQVHKCSSPCKRNCHNGQAPKECVDKCNFRSH